MRTFILLALVATVVALGLTMAPTSQPSRYGTALGTSVAFAQDDEVIPPKPRPDPACQRACLSANGVKFCGTGTGVKGCKSIVNNNCIFVICPL
ncbi:MAG TPA: hypothetical protein VFQ05_15895 [Candidatus Eisenbacteria bacterium]|nr:hypothetical protein [Candidatus Eisenbacteria bacterium]